MAEESSERARPGRPAFAGTPGTDPTPDATEPSAEEGAGASGDGEADLARGDDLGHADGADEGGEPLDDELDDELESDELEDDDPENDDWDEDPDGVSRGAHFTRLAFHPVTLSYGTIAAIAVFSILVVAAGPIAGAIGAAVVFAATYWIVFVLAGRRTGGGVYAEYADDRGLYLTPQGDLPEATPLLRRGDDRGAEQILSGVLPGGLEGTLALYTYEVEADDAGEEQENDYFDHTIVLADLRDVPEQAAEIYCQHRGGPSPPGAAAEVGPQALQLGSWTFDARYELRIGSASSEEAVRRLLSSDFVDWLTRDAPGELGFELVNGSLCTYVEDYADTFEDLDELCEAAGIIASHLRGEPAASGRSDETDGRGAGAPTDEGGEPGSPGRM
ncbi:MAG: hypothetical protein ACR2N5_04860 [Solirubrobacterales bacterium]